MVDLKVFAPSRIALSRSAGTGRLPSASARLAEDYSPTIGTSCTDLDQREQRRSQAIRVANGEPSSRRADPSGLVTGVVVTVLFAALLHASWSAIVKSAPDHVAGFTALSVTSLAIGGVGVGLAPIPDPASYPWLAISGVLHVLYMFLLAWSYRIGDFSHVYPLARGTSPVLVTVLGLVALGESVSPLRLGGVMGVCTGLLALGLAGANAAPTGRWAVRVALLTGVAITAYTVADGVGVRRSGTVLGYAVWLQLLMGAASSWSSRCGGDRARSPFLCVQLGARRERRPGRSIGVRPRDASADPREYRNSVRAAGDSIVVAALLIGSVVFGEPLGRVRTFAAVLVAAGVVALAPPQGSGGP